MHSCNDCVLRRKNPRWWVLQGKATIPPQDSTQGVGEDRHQTHSVSVPMSYVMPPLGVRETSKGDFIRRRVRPESRPALPPPPTSVATYSSVTFSPIVGVSSGSRRTGEAKQSTASAEQISHTSGRHALTRERPIHPLADDGAPTDLLSYEADIVPKTPPLPGWPPSHTFLMEMEKSAKRTPEKHRSWQRGPLLLSPRNCTATEVAAAAVQEQQPPGLTPYHPGSIPPSSKTYREGSVPPGLATYQEGSLPKLGGGEEEGGGGENLQPSPAGTEIVSDFSSTAKSANASLTGAVTTPGGTLKNVSCSNSNDNINGGGGGGGGGWAGWSGFMLTKSAGDSCDKGSSLTQGAEADEVSQYKPVYITLRDL